MELCATTSNSYVLYFSHRERHGILFLGYPRDKIVSKIEAITWSTLSIIHTSYPISIWITCKTSIRVLWVPQAIIRSSIDVLYDSLHYSQMGFLQSNLISSTKTQSQGPAKCTLLSFSSYSLTHYPYMIPT